MEVSYFQDRLNRVATRLDEINGELITLRRGFASTTGITASPILMNAEEIIPSIAVTRVEYQAWGMDVAAYQLSGAAVVPLEGDIIERADGTQFRLVSENGEPPWEHTTSDRVRYLLHTERVL